MVHRILKRTLGPGSEVEDLAQEVFLCLFARPARCASRRSSRHSSSPSPRSLRALSCAAAVLGDGFTSMSTSLLRCTTIPKRGKRWFGSTRILDGMGAEDRTAFVLRFMEDVELTEVASALDVSLSTTKRRLARVWKRISILVQRDPALAHYLSSIQPIEPQDLS